MEPRPPVWKYNRWPDSIKCKWTVCPGLLGRHPGSFSVYGIGFIYDHAQPCSRNIMDGPPFACRGAAAPLRRPRNPDARMNVIPGSLGAILRSYKSAVTRRININRQTPGIPVWQRNYYEHIVRNEGELDRIREYIRNNPLAWEWDEEYSE